MRVPRWYQELRDFDWNELVELDTFDVWPTSVKNVLVALFFSVCLFAGYVLLVRGLMAAAENAEALATELGHELQTQQSELLAVNRERQMLANLQSKVAEQAGQLLTRAGVPALLDLLTESAAANGLQIDELELESEVEQAFLVRLPMRLVARGAYRSVVTFWQELAAYPLLVVPLDFQLSSSEQDDELRLELKLEAYRATGAFSEAGGLAWQRPTLHAAPPTRNPFATRSNGSPAKDDEHRRRLEALEHVDLSELTLCGTLARGGQRWALVRDPTGLITRVGIGARMGRNEGRVVAISREHIELIERRVEEDEWRERRSVLRLARPD